MKYRVTQRMPDKSESTFYCSNLSEIENRVGKTFASLYITSEVANDSIVEMDEFIRSSPKVTVNLKKYSVKCIQVDWDKLMELKNSITVNDIHFDDFDDKYAVLTMNYYNGTEWSAYQKLAVPLVNTKKKGK